MILDTLSNSSRYTAIHPLFAPAFNYLLSQDLENWEPGKYDIAEGLKVIVSEKGGMTTEESTAKFECHNQHIDIQLCIRGSETMGWRPRSGCTEPKGDYNPDKDVSFYHDAPEMYFQLHDREFAIFFPEDVHAPMIGDGVIKKAVVKVRIG